MSDLEDDNETPGLPGFAWKQASTVREVVVEKPRPRTDPHRRDIDSLLHESERDFARALRDDLDRLYQPQDTLEAWVIDRIVLASVKLQRVEQMELTALTSAPEDLGPNFPSRKTLTEYRNSLCRERQDSLDQLLKYIRLRPPTQEQRLIWLDYILDLKEKADAIARAAGVRPAC